MNFKIAHEAQSDWQRRPHMTKRVDETCTCMRERMKTREEDPPFPFLLRNTFDSDMKIEIFCCILSRSFRALLHALGLVPGVRVLGLARAGEEARRVQPGHEQRHHRPGSHEEREQAGTVREIAVAAHV